MYKAVVRSDDEDFIRHLEREHPDELAHRWTRAGHGRRMLTRKLYETYHDFWLHRSNPTKATHEHDGYLWEGKDMVKLLKGWLQQTRCVCLEPPEHREDCPGNRGVLVLNEMHGASAREKLWEELDKGTAGLMDYAASIISPVQTEAQKNFTRGIAFALAIMENPVEPDIDSIRKEAMRRWRATQ